MAELNSIDFVIIAIFALSFLVGLYRGLLRELVSLFTWIVAFVLAFLHGKTAGQIFTFVDSESLKKILGTAMIFVTVVVAGIVAKYFIFRSMNVGKPSVLGRLFGAAYGVGRATIVVIFGLLFLTTEKIEDNNLYQDSQLIPKLNIVVDYFDLKIPDKWHKPKTQTDQTEMTLENVEVITPESPK